MGFNRKELSEKIAGLIRSKKEGKTWDFKEKWYKDKKDFVRTILAMANNATIDDSYIIIGVKDKSCLPSDGPDWRKGAFKQTSDLNNWLRDIPFDNFNYPDLELETAVNVRAKVDGTEHDYSLDVIVIKSTANVPYYLSSDLQCKKGVKKQEIYIRMKDQNVLATPLELEELYRKRFGLSLNIEERFNILLANKDDWWFMDKIQLDYTDEYEGEFELLKHKVIVNKYCPDFYIDVIPAKNCSPRPLYGDLFGTYTEVETQYIRWFFRDFLVGKFIYDYIDRCQSSFVRPAREWDFWYDDDRDSGLYHYFPKYHYYYFVKNDIRWNLDNVMLMYDGDATNESLRKCERVQKYVIYFENEGEKNEYDKYLRSNVKTIKENIENLEERYEKAKNEYFNRKFLKGDDKEIEIIYDVNDLKNWNPRVTSDSIVGMVMEHGLAPKYFVKKFYEWKKEKA